jgi:hypothetical protein
VISRLQITVPVPAIYIQGVQRVYNNRTNYGSE